MTEAEASRAKHNLHPKGEGASSHGDAREGELQALHAKVSEISQELGLLNLAGPAGNLARMSELRNLLTGALAAIHKLERELYG